MLAHCARRCIPCQATSTTPTRWTRPWSDLSIALAKSGEPSSSVVPHSERHHPSSAPHAGAGQVGIIDLAYMLQAGKRLYVERIDIHGNTKTRDDVIRANSISAKAMLTIAPWSTAASVI